MLSTIVYDLLIILTAGLLAGLLCRSLRVSGLVGYLAVGIIIGKGCFDWIGDEHHEIEYIAEAGVFLLLFSIGLGRALAVGSKPGGRGQCSNAPGCLAGCFVLAGHRC